jgi:hypothetical protein
MKLIYGARLMACMLLLAGASNAAAQTPNVMLSMNVFPTNLANPNGGGTWRIVAKTDSSQGIAGISAYLANVSTIGLDVENDIGHDLSDPNFAIISGTVNLVYGQDLTTSPLVGGVGTPALGDGPDPFGDPAWNNATRIFSGLYSSVVPSFAIAGSNETDANTFAQVVVNSAAVDANTTTVVRVAVPEPATAVLAGVAILGIAASRRRRSA